MKIIFTVYLRFSVCSFGAKPGEGLLQGSREHCGNSYPHPQGLRPIFWLSYQVRPFLPVCLPQRSPSLKVMTTFMVWMSKKRATKKTMDASLAFLFLFILIPASESVPYLNYFVSATGSGNCGEASPCTFQTAFAQVWPQ